MRSFCRLAVGVLAGALALAGCANDAGPDVGSPKRVRILSGEQYLNTVAYIFGDDVRLPVNFTPLPRRDGLQQVGAATAGISATQVEQNERAAAAIVARIGSPVHREYLFPCKPADDHAADRACATEILSSVGRLLYRRPMPAELLDHAVTTAGDTAERLKDFYAGISVVLEGMLLSPQVMLVADRSEPDPDRPGKERLDGYSIATRLSLFLWNAGPDERLLQAAERGELHSAAGRARVVDAMLASPRLEAGVRAFFEDMFDFEQFAGLAKDPLIYPAFTGATAADAREQTLRTIVDHLLVRKGDYRDLFTTRETFLRPTLGAFYREPAGEWSRYEAPPTSPRAGLLTQVSFLALHSHPGRSSPTKRGKALRELLLCQVVPTPPPNVDFSALNNPDPNIKTQRERVAFHLQDPVCAGCHKITDPIGLALENFDGSGQFQAREHGALIDTSGSLDGKDFKDATGLAQALHDHPALPACLVQRAYAYATGGPTDPLSDRPMLAYLNERFAKQGHRLPDLMRTIALSDAFATVRPEREPDPDEDE